MFNHLLTSPDTDLCPKHYNMVMFTNQFRWGAGSVLWKGPSSVGRLLSADSLRSPENTATVSMKGLHINTNVHTLTHTKVITPSLARIHRCISQHIHRQARTHPHTKVGHTHLHMLHPHTNHTHMHHTSTHTTFTRIHAAVGMWHAGTTHTNTHLDRSCAQAQPLPLCS